MWEKENKMDAVKILGYNLKYLEAKSKLKDPNEFIAIPKYEVEINTDFFEKINNKENTKMDAVEFLNEKNRMMIKDPKFYNRLKDITTNDVLVEYVKQWSKDNPIKTRAQDFKEKYPNSDSFEDGTPKVCASVLGYCEKCTIIGDYSRGCVDCWNEPVE